MWDGHLLGVFFGQATVISKDMSEIPKPVRTNDELGRGILTPSNIVQSTYPGCAVPDA